MVNMIRRVLIGAIAGTLGTLAMDLIWYRRYRSAGGSQPFLAWETSEGTESYETAAAPAQTAKVVADFVGVELPDSSARAVNNVVHWITGVGWGKVHGTAAAILGTTTPLLGPVTGVVAWGTSYVVLPRLGVYKPMREYETDVLWQDLSATWYMGRRSVSPSGCSPDEAASPPACKRTCAGMRCLNRLAAPVLWSRTPVSHSWLQEGLAP